MAVIGNSFDLQKAIDNQGYAYKCWFNYEKTGNTMRISDADMKTVLDAWSGHLANWEANAERDVTEYSIEGDYEWNSALDEGKEEAKDVAVNDKTKWGGSTTNSKNKNIANGVVAGVGGAAGAAVTAVSMGLQSMTTTIGGVTNVPLGFVIAAPLEMAVGILYEATHPNRNENKALEELKSFMETGQSNMKASVVEMEQTDLEITQLTTDSETDKATTEEEIAKKQDLIRTAQAAYEAIVARVKAGEPLSSTDRDKLNASKAQIATLQGEIEALQQASIDFSTANSDTISEKKSLFDAHAQNIAKEKGITDYASTFDEATNKGAKFQVAMHSLNFAASVLTTVQAAIFAATPFTLWALAFVGMAASGAGMSAHAIVEQSKIIADTNKELDVRENTEVIIDDSMDNYENKLRNVVAQGEFVDAGLAELSEFEQETITLENAPATNSDNNTGGTSDTSSSNPFGDNQDDQGGKKKSSNPFA